MQVPHIFYISGRGGDIHTGLGEYLKKLSKNFDGLSLTDSFLNTPFSEQVSELRTAITAATEKQARIVANSYGAYLFLHALINLPKIESRVLLLSPVLGACMTESRYIRPPGVKTLYQALQDNLIPVPEHIELHTGEDDKTCAPVMACEFNELIPLHKLKIIPHQGHMIDKPVVRRIVKDFLFP